MGTQVGKEVRKMSEEQKRQAEVIAEVFNKLDEKNREVAIAYIRGLADASRLMQQKTA